MYPCPERPAWGAFVWHQAQQLRGLGHTVDVVNILGFRSKLNYLKGAVEVLHKTSGMAYDIVHAHYGLSAFPAWFRLQQPLVITLHGGDVLGPAFQRFCTRLISRFADSVIIVSEEMQRHIPGIVIPCGVDLNVFRPHDRDEARSRLGWPRDKYLVLFPFDRTRLQKRYDLAKAAVEQVAGQGVDAELVTVSSIENSEMPWYYSAADAMILCSNREGSPTSVKEALACNLPVVATDVGDVREIMRGVEGARICKQEVSDIARNLRDVLDISRSGRFEGRAAMLKYDQARTVQKIVDVYEDVLRNRQRKRSA
jgi:glycosyltransferase involved in cell wall biosynthesis